MTTEELEHLLAQQPVAVLHRLAHGRVQRHFRAGKRRLIQLLLQHSSQNRAGLESDLQALVQDRQSRLPVPEKAASPARRTGAPTRKHTSHQADPESSGPAVSLATWLEGIGVPPPQPFVADPWQEE